MTKIRSKVVIRGFPESYWGMSQKYFEQKVFDTRKLRSTYDTNLPCLSLLRPITVEFILKVS